MGCDVLSFDDQYTTSIQFRYFTAAAEWCTQRYIYESACGNLTIVSTCSNFYMSNLAIEPHPARYKKSNLLKDYVPSRGYYNPHLTLLMLPFCTEQENFLQFIYLIYSFVTEHIFKLFLCIYQLTPCTITEFADGYFELLNWISYLKLIAELPCRTIFELTLHFHQNMMHRHDYAALKIRSCHYTLKKQYRCRVYA